MNPDILQNAYDHRPPVHPGVGALAAALAKAQSQITQPLKNREVAVKTQTGSTYHFAYATLDSIIDCLRVPLTSNGLWFTQTVEDQNGKPTLLTTLMHESGQFVTSHSPIIVSEGSNKSQAFGSALTYARRYAIAAMFSIAADEDDDGNAADGNEATIKPKAQKPKPQQETSVGAKNALASVLRTLVSRQDLGEVFVSPSSDGLKARAGLIAQHLGIESDWSTLTDEQCRTLSAKLVEHYGVKP